MTTTDAQVWHLVDKSAYPDGIWKTEPDKMQWTNEATGLECIVRRHEAYGHLNGYVGVPDTHPFAGVPASEIPFAIKGTEINYAAPSHRGDPISGIRLQEEDDRTDDLWWFGFDFGHGWHVSPGMHTGDFGRQTLADALQFAEYREMGYAFRACNLFALLVSAFEKAPLEARVLTTTGMKLAGDPDAQRGAPEGSLPRIQ